LRQTGGTIAPAYLLLPENRQPDKKMQQNKKSGGKLHGKAGRHM